MDMGGVGNKTQIILIWAIQCMCGAIYEGRTFVHETGMGREEKMSSSLDFEIWDPHGTLKQRFPQKLNMDLNHSLVIWTGDKELLKIYCNSSGEWKNID